MYKLRQTWNEVFPVRTLYEIDVCVKKIDPAWPITAVLANTNSSSSSSSLSSANSTLNTTATSLITNEQPVHNINNNAAKTFAQNASNKISQNNSGINGAAVSSNSNSTMPPNTINKITTTSVTSLQEVKKIFFSSFFSLSFS